MLRRVNRMCGPAVVVREAGWAESADFSARFSAKWRHYRYDIWNAPEPNAFLAPTSWHVYQPLSMPLLRLACDPLIGEHDFSSFCRKPRSVPGQADPSMKRNVMLARWSEVPTDYGAGLLRFEIRANAFCHQMVRAIVGTMVDAGAGRLPAGEMRGILLGKDRQAAGPGCPTARSVPVGSRVRLTQFGGHVGNNAANMVVESGAHPPGGLMSSQRILIISTPVGPLGSGVGGGVELTLHSLVLGLTGRGHHGGGAGAGRVAARRRRRAPDPGNAATDRPHGGSGHHRQCSGGRSVGGDVRVGASPPGRVRRHPQPRLRLAAVLPHAVLRRRRHWPTWSAWRR